MKLDEMMSRLPVERRLKVETRARTLIDEEMKRRTAPKASVKALLHQAEKAIANGGRGIDITHLSDEELKLQLRLAHKIMEEDRELLARPEMDDDWDGGLAYPYSVFQSDDGAWQVRFPDVPEALTEGDTEAEAHAMAQDALLAALGGLAKVKRSLPIPSKAKAGQHVVVVPMVEAAKFV